MPTTAAPRRARPEDPADPMELPLYRLHLMRAGYALMGVGLMIFRVPDLVVHAEPWPLKESVVVSMLTAMALLALLGLRYPVRMLPLSLFEVLWKLIWLGAVAVPAMLADEVDAAMAEVLSSCSLIVIVVAVIPWGHVWRNFVTVRGDRVR